MDEVKENGMETNEHESKTKAIVREIFSWVWTILLALVIALFLNHFIIVNANVPTGSMQDTIQPGDRLIGFRLAYLKNGPQRGDIIIFDFPLDEEQTYIKRVIGLPGEHIEIHDGLVYIDGSSEPLAEKYLREEWIEKNDGISYDIPEDCYFVMGDNRNNSLDGRYWAQEAVRLELAESLEDAEWMEYCFVNREQILGKALFRYFPSVTWLDTDPYDESAVSD